MMLCLKSSSKLVYSAEVLFLSPSLFSIVNWTPVLQSHTKVIDLYRGFHMNTAFSLTILSKWIRLKTIYLKIVISLVQGSLT